MHLPTINHIDLSLIKNFPMLSLTSSVNLQRLDISCLMLEEDGPEIAVQSEMMPKIRDFHTSDSSLLTTNLLLAIRQDGQPAFNFMDLRRLTISSACPEDEWNIRYLLQNAKLLEKLHLSVGLSWGLVGLHDILSPSASTLKILHLTVSLDVGLPLAGLCDELEAMAGHNMLEALSFLVRVDGDESEDSIGPIIQNVEKVLVKPGWCALKQVSFELAIACCQVSREDSAKLSEALQSLPDKYLTHLSKLESVAFNFSAYVVECIFDIEL